jgi:CDP-diglyceride synthetase
MDKKVLLILDYLLPALAAILLAWEWWRRRATRRWPVSLIVVTISCLWFLLALNWSGAIGPGYSNLRAAILVANLLAVVTVALISVIVRSQRSLRVVLSALTMAWVWFVTLSIMYAV